jgi:hypothetical protein
MGTKIWAVPVAEMMNPMEIHQYIVLLVYTSAGVPSKVIADIKLDSRDRATGNVCIDRPANRNSFSSVFFLSLMA